MRGIFGCGDRRLLSELPGPDVQISETLCMALFDAFGQGDSWAVLPG